MRLLHLIRHAPVTVDPDRVSADWETANETLRRFERAIRGFLEETEDDELVVSHGAVMSLFLATAGNRSPMALWSELKCPDHVAVHWPDRSTA